MKNIIIVLTGVCTVGAWAATLSSGKNLVPQYSKDVDFRIKRQSNATTTAEPRKDRPSNVFKLISVLISETRNDTSRAFNEIGNLFNSQFAENTPKPTKNQHAVSSTTPDPTSDSDEDNEITTTTEPYRITREEFFGILRSNVRGLMRLFQKELGNALRELSELVTVPPGHNQECKEVWEGVPECDYAIRDLKQKKFVQIVKLFIYVKLVLVIFMFSLLGWIS